MTRVGGGDNRGKKGKSLIKELMGMDNKGGESL